MPSHEIIRQPAFTQLNPAELEAYDSIAHEIGINSLRVPELRNREVVQTVANRFLGWTALEHINPDYSHIQTIGMHEGHAVSDKIKSERVFKEPHHRVGLVKKLTGRGADHGHGHGHQLEIPTSFTRTPDEDFWLISEITHGVKPNYSRYDKWLVGGARSGTDDIRADLYHNHQGRLWLESGKPDKPISSSELNRQLGQLGTYKPETTRLPDTFTASHIVNKAARIAIQQSKNPDTF